ncbi:hypothetical protein HDV04_000498 [Boothiomyces sp. JEL0838]|nr:hypothetical protein HDV04_000498 [Boothiomyces sp. JEL0838]
MLNQQTIHSITDNQIEKLLLDGSSIYPKEAQELADVLRNNISVKTLDLSWNKLGSGLDNVVVSIENTNISELLLNHTMPASESIKVLCQYVAKSTKLTKLDLGYNNLKNDDLQELVNAVQASPSLTEMNLYLNTFDKLGTNLAAKLLNTHLTTLNLTNCGIGPDGDAIIGNALKTSRIKNLNINNNDIGNISNICTGLKCNHSIEALSLSGNAINDSGLKELGSAIAEHPLLRALVLFDNQFTKTGFNELCGFLSKNQVLRKLGLSMFNTDSELTHFQDLLASGIKELHLITSLPFNDIDMITIVHHLMENTGLVEFKSNYPILYVEGITKRNTLIAEKLDNDVREAIRASRVISKLKLPMEIKLDILSHFLLGYKPNQIYKVSLFLLETLARKTLDFGYRFDANELWFQAWKYYLK